MPKHAGYRYSMDSVERALQHHKDKRRITYLERTEKGFRIRLAASYSLNVDKYSLRDAYFLNLGLVTMERIGEQER